MLLLVTRRGEEDGHCGGRNPRTEAQRRMVLVCIVPCVSWIAKNHVVPTLCQAELQLMEVPRLNLDSEIDLKITDLLDRAPDVPPKPRCKPGSKQRVVQQNIPCVLVSFKSRT